MHYEDDDFSLDLPDGWSYTAPVMVDGLSERNLWTSRIITGPNGWIKVDIYRPWRSQRDRRARELYYNWILPRYFRLRNVIEMAPNTKLGDERNTTGHEFDEVGERHAMVMAVRYGRMVVIDFNVDLTDGSRELLDMAMRSFKFGDSFHRDKWPFIRRTVWWRIRRWL